MGELILQAVYVWVKMGHLKSFRSASAPIRVNKCLSNYDQEALGATLLPKRT